MSDQILRSLVHELQNRVEALEKLIPNQLDKSEGAPWVDLYLKPEDFPESIAYSFVEVDSLGERYVWLLAGHRLSFQIALFGGSDYTFAVKCCSLGFENAEQANLTDATLIIEGGTRTSPLFTENRLTFSLPFFEGYREVECALELPHGFCPKEVNSSSQDHRRLALRCYGISIQKRSLGARIKLNPAGQKDSSMPSGVEAN